LSAGAHQGKSFMIPRIPLKPANPRDPFVMTRTQFPVKLAFVQTINKSQGQTLTRVGLYLPAHVFSHGHLYVALSRVGSFDNLKILATYTHAHKSMGGEIRIDTKNIVFHEVLQDLVNDSDYPDYSQIVLDQQIQEVCDGSSISQTQ